MHDYVCKNCYLTGLIGVNNVEHLVAEEISQKVNLESSFIIFLVTATH